MSCWDVEPKTDEEISASMEALMKHPIYVKFFQVPVSDSADLLKQLDKPVDYLKLMK